MESLYKKRIFLLILLFLLLIMLQVDQSNAKKSKNLTQKKNISTSLYTIKNNNFKVSALIDKSITLTCSIDLDNKNFSKSGNYKVCFRSLI